MALFDSIKQFFGGKKKEEQLPQILRAPETIGPLVLPAGTNKAIGDFGKSILQSTVRSVPELAMSAVDLFTKGDTVKPVEIPSSPVTQFLLGSKPLKTVQQRSTEASKEYGVPKYVSAPLVFAGSVLDLPGPGLIKKPIQETLELTSKKIIKNLGKNLEKEGTTFLLDEFQRMAKPSVKFLEELIDKKTIETATHTLSYDPTTKMIDVLPKVISKVDKPIITKAATAVVDTVVPELKPVEKLITNQSNIRIPKPQSVVADGVKLSRTKLPTPKLDEVIPNIIRTDSGKIIKPTTKFGETPFDRVEQTQKGFNQLMDEADDLLAETFGASKVRKRVVDVIGTDDVGNLIKEIPNIKDKGGLTLTGSFLNRALEKVGGMGTQTSSTLKRILYEPTKMAGIRFADDMDSYAKRINNAFKGIKLGDSLDSAVMSFGEKYGREIVNNPQAITELTSELARLGKQDQVGTVLNAIVESRNVYDELLGGINRELTRFGYSEMPSLPNYFTHIAELTDVNGKFYPTLRNLETSMAGINFNTKPGKTFAQFALKRKGETPEVMSALAGLKRYVPVALQQQHYIDPIQRFRATAQLLRQQVGEVPGVPSNHLSEFVGWLDTVASLMAGKNIGAYKLIEQSIGRKGAELLKTMDSLTGLNLMAYNVGASLSNLAVLTNSLARTGVDSFGKAIVNTVKNVGGSNLIDGMKSEFLSGRYFDRIDAKSITEKSADLGMKLFEVIDRFSSETVLRSFYDDFIKKGMSSAEALKLADQLAMEQIGNRMVGMSPVIIKQLPIISKFSLEPMNYIDTIIHDIPRDFQGKAVEGAWLLSKIILLNYVANETYQQMTGRRILPDPINMGQNLKDIWEKPGDTGAKITNSLPLVAKEIPLVQTFTGGGRIPITAGLPDLNTVTEDPVAALIKLSTLFNPLGGSQEAYKTYTAYKDYTKGYSEDKQGRVKYPVAPSVANALRVPMGKYAFPEAVTYYDEGLSPLGAEDSNLMKNLPQEQQPKYWSTSQLVRKTNEPSSAVQSMFTRLNTMIFDPNISNEEKISFYNKIKPRIAELQRYYPNEIKRFAKVLGIKPDDDVVTNDTSKASPETPRQTINPFELSNITRGGVSLGRGKKVTPKKATLKKTPGIKVPTSTSRVRIKKMVAPKFKGGLVKTRVPKKSGVKVGYKKPTINGLRVKV